jgi:protein-S-isoprenylcysteine O-methyltransferase Ste14
MYWGRVYFALQAVGGAAWWMAVAASDVVRQSTLGGLDPLMVAALDIPLFVVASGVAALGVRGAAWIAASWTVAVALALAVYSTVTTEAGWGVILMFPAAGGSVIALCLLVAGRVPTAWIAAGPFAFRPASARGSSAVHLGATFLQIALFWGFFLGVLPVLIAMLEQRWGVGIPVTAAVPAAGFVVFVLASALGVWSAITMATIGRGTPLPAAMPNRLVIAGPYVFVRNPMAMSGIVQGAAVGFVLSSWLVVAYALVGSLLWNYAVRPLEERDLEQRFGEAYRQYRDSVWCWIPRLPSAHNSAVGEGARR